MKSFLALLLIIIASPYTKAQRHVPGYVVSKEGDTIRCDIAYKRWDNSPLAISVLRNGREATYGPAEIKGFFVADELYRTATVDVETSPFRLDRLDEHSNFVYEKRTVFLQSLVDGKKQLSFLKDQEGKNHFYIGDGELVHLDYKRYIKVKRMPNGNDDRGTMENSRYVGQLITYLDCPGINNRISATAYNEQSMRRLFDQYRLECSAANDIVVMGRRLIALEISLVAGVSVTHLRFTGPGEGSQHLRISEYKSSAAPTVGLALGLKMLRGKGSRITNDIMYTYFNVEGAGRLTSPGSVGYNTTSNFRFAYLKSHHAFQLALVDNGKAYVSGGLSLGLALKKESTQRIIYDTQQTTTPTIALDGFEYGLVAGVGTNLGRFGADLRFEWSTGISDQGPLHGYLTRGYAIVNYRLKG